MRKALGLLVLVAASAFAEEPPKAPAPSVVSIADWRRIADGAAPDETTLDRVKRLRASAASVLVECVGRVRDVRPDGERIELVVCEQYGVRDLRTIRIDSAEADTWKRWDRVRWLVRPVVRDDAEIQFELLDGITRIPNPGPEAAPIAKAAGTPVQWKAWIASFAAAHYKGSPDGYWATGCEKTWIAPAVVLSFDPVVTVHLEGDFAYDISEQVPVRANGMTIWEPRFLRTIGLCAKTYEIQGVDPQLVDALKIGSKVDVTVDLMPNCGRNAGYGEFPATLRVWRLRKK